MKIGICGCGPGGLASALLLHRLGHQITLFDQFEKPRPLGSGLLIQPSGQMVLAQLGLLDVIRALSTPVTRLYGLNTESGKRALDMEYHYLGASVSALGIHRASLFQTLFDAVNEENITILPGHELVGAVKRDGAICPTFCKGEGEAFDVLIDACGADSPLASGEATQLPFAALWASVDFPAGQDIAVAALDQRYFGSRKMAGIMPVGVNPATGNPGAALFWSIKPEDYPVLKQRGLEAWKQEYLSLWPEAESFVRQIHSFDQMTLAIYRHRTSKPVSYCGVLHIGDSWHCTSPQLGQGANMALLDAAAIASAIKHSTDLAETARRYRHLRSDHVALYQALSFVFTPLYQSDSLVLPWFRDKIIHHCARWPLVRLLIAQVVSGNLGRIS